MKSSFNLDKKRMRTLGLQELPDGSVIDLTSQSDQSLSDKSRGDQSQIDFYDNLVPLIDSFDLTKMGASLKQKCDDDFSAREGWIQTLEDGLRQTDLHYEDRTYPFQTASGAKSSALMQVISSFIAHTSAELFPPSGPVRVKVLGEATEDKRARAERVEAFLNFYLTEVCKDYYVDKEQMLFWCALSGVYSKIYIDPIRKSPVAKFIRPQEFCVSQGASSLADAERLTQIIRLEGRQFKRLVSEGYYESPLLPLESLLSGGDENDDSVSEVIQEIAGIEAPQETRESISLYECHTFLDIEADLLATQNFPHPYIVTMDKSSGMILRIIRNWRQNDPSCERQNFYVHYNYMPGVNINGYGLAHLCHSNIKSATSLLRQVVDSGTFANFPGFLKRKGLKSDDNNLRIGPGEAYEIDTQDEPLDNWIRPLPFKEPSQVLLALKDGFEKSVFDIAGSNDSPVAEMNPAAPVGTTLALIEQSGAVMSAVTRRLHRSLNEELSIFYRLFSEILTHQGYPYTLSNSQHFLMKDDFRGDFNIVPSSDPNATSRMQRMVRSDALLKLAASNPQLFNMEEVNKAYLSDLYPGTDISIYMAPPPAPTPPPPPPEVVTSDPVEENRSFLLGLELKADLTQDHDAHILVHQTFLSELMSGASGIDQTIPPLHLLKSHILEHERLALFASVAQNAQIPFDLAQSMIAKSPAPPVGHPPVGSPGTGAPPVGATGMPVPVKTVPVLTVPMVIQNQMALLTSQKIRQQIQAKLEAEQQAEAARLESLEMNAPLDPVRVESEVAMRDIDVREQSLTVKSQVDALKLQIDLLKAQNKHEIDKMKMENQRLVDSIRYGIPLHNLDDFQLRGETEEVSRTPVSDPPVSDPPVSDPPVGETPVSETQGVWTQGVGIPNNIPPNNL